MVGSIIKWNKMCFWVKTKLVSNREGDKTILVSNRKGDYILNKVEKWKRSKVRVWEHCDKNLFIKIFPFFSFIEMVLTYIVVYNYIK